MILDTPLDIKGPYSLKGTADVYWSQGRWIARSWPKRPKQPNSASQVFSRECFRKMLADRAALSPVEIALWQNSNYPPDKTWDDVYRSSRLKIYHQGFSSWPWGQQVLPLYYARLNNTNFAWYPWKYWHIIGQWSTEWPPYMSGTTGVWLVKNDTDRLRWIVNGMLCYKGRKEVPHYYPTFPNWQQYPQYWVGRYINGQPFVGKGIGSDDIAPTAAAGIYNYKPSSYSIKSYVYCQPEIVRYTPDIIADG
jgi:hypothetical protein